MPHYPTLLNTSFSHWMGCSIAAHAGLPEPSANDLEDFLYHAPFALVSHGTQDDPIFCYANIAAQKLWEMDWDAFVQMPSRHSAEPVADIQDERQTLLKAAMAKGWIKDYSGIRISSTGKRFQIANTILWNVVDEAGTRYGQAALIMSWKHL